MGNPSMCEGELPPRPPAPARPAWPGLTTRELAYRLAYDERRIHITAQFVHIHEIMQMVYKDNLRIELGDAFHGARFYPIYNSHRPIVAFIPHR